MSSQLKYKGELIPLYCTSIVYRNEALGEMFYLKQHNIRFTWT
ncbi:MAG: hypothetical protein AAGE96_13175 [Cyanobacteria bacterium P01_G01_bin.19]